MSYVCPTHEITLDTYCPACVADMDNAPDPAAMTGEQRVAEMERWGGVVTVESSRCHHRIEALVGRPVWTHEMGLAWPELLEAAWARTCQPATLESLMAPLEEMGKPVMVIAMPEPEGDA